MTPITGFARVVRSGAPNAARNHFLGKRAQSRRTFDYDELVSPDKANLDIFCLREESLDDAASPEDADAIAADIIEDLQTALDEISLIYADLAKTD